MTTTLSEPPIDADREREIAQARAEVIRRAEVQGVPPFATLEELAGEPEMTADFDVDEFLLQVREGRTPAKTQKAE